MSRIVTSQIVCIYVRLYIELFMSNFASKADATICINLNLYYVTIQLESHADFIIRQQL